MIYQNMLSTYICHALGRICRQKITQFTKKVRKNSFIQKLIIEGMIFSLQNYTSKYRSGQDLPEYVIKTYLSCIRKNVQTKNNPIH